MNQFEFKDNKNQTIKAQFKETLFEMGIWPLRFFQALNVLQDIDYFEVSK